MRNNQQTPESAAAWARWLRDPDRSHNPNAYALLATLLDGLAAQVQEAERVCAEAYQVVGVMLNDLGIFDTERATKVLDNLSAAEQVHKDVLPWATVYPPSELKFCGGCGEGVTTFCRGNVGKCPLNLPRAQAQKDPS